MKLAVFTFSLLCISVMAISQTADFSTSELPKTKEEYIKSEPDLLAAVHWLETTPIGDQMELRQKVSAYVVAWITNSPTVTVEIRLFATKLADKNPHLLIVFMGAYAAYCVQNNYSTDLVKCNLAGTKAALQCYQLGGDVKKNKTITKATEADQNGKLEEWVAEEMKHN